MATIEEAKKAIAASSQESSVYIGCDSIRFRKKENGKVVWYARYSTVVILHLDSAKGCQLFHDTVVMPDYGSIKQRMLTEVGFAVQHASELLEAIGDRHFEIHLDINRDPKHKSNVALSEARGYILGTFGFEPQFKPDGFAATHAADHVVRCGY